MSILLATLCLNEMEHLPKLYAQHKDWPGLRDWVFVESADRVYARSNPDLVSHNGLSVDGTSKYLANLASQDPRVTYIAHGFADHTDPAQCKVAARQRYLDVANQLQPQFVFVLDADEYYPRSTQIDINSCMQGCSLAHNSFLFKQRHIWYPESLHEQSMFCYEVVGGYWAVPHCRGWRWISGMQYRNNHNTPETPNGVSLGSTMLRFDKLPNHIECIHLGFASSTKLRAAKHHYYVARGEGAKDGRQWYVDCRSAFETWEPGQPLPYGAKVIPYLGPVPEVFQG